MPFFKPTFRQAHNLKVAGSNPAPATIPYRMGGRDLRLRGAATDTKTDTSFAAPSVLRNYCRVLSHCSLTRWICFPVRSYPMKNRFRLIQRGLRGGMFYCVDSETGRRETLGTKDPDEAAQIVLVKNQAVRQPALNLQMAKAFLAASDDDLGKRTWQQALDALVDAKHDAERRLSYEVAWHLGASQTDIALLTADNIDWQARIITFERLKTGQPCVVHFGDDFAAVLEKLPKQGSLFPTFLKLKEGHRSTHFKRTCRKAGVNGVTLQSYRYAWAQRARVAGGDKRGHCGRERSGVNGLSQVAVAAGAFASPWRSAGFQTGLELADGLVDTLQQ
jgi:integrase